jgi:hypothetical protein
MQKITVLNIKGREHEFNELCKHAGNQENLKILPCAFYREFDKDIVRLFMHVNALYTLPTTELIEFLFHQISGKEAIEIGCGSGHIANSLKIPATDLKVQEAQEIRFMYTLNGQPLIVYPDHVEKLEAMEAINKYRPEIVIGSYITKQFDGTDGNMYAPDETAIIRKTGTYIHIGDLNTHSDKPLMKHKHEIVQPDWLIVRGKRGFIGIWND